MTPSYRILMFAMSSHREWERGIRNRNYYIVHELLKRPDVSEIIMVEYLPIQWRKKFAAFLFVSLGIYKTGHRVINKDYGGILYQVSDKLKVYTAYSMRGLLLRLSQFVKNQKNQEKLILWSYFPLYVKYIRAFPHALTVFDAVDDWRAHPAYHKYIRILAKNYAAIAQKADFIFTVSEHLKQHLFSDHQNTAWIPNGVDAENAAVENCEAVLSVGEAGARASEKIANEKKIVVGYVGTIQSRIDFELICFLAKSHPGKQFVLVGPVWKDAEAYRISECGNVIFTGPVPHDELKAYLATFDAAIIPHKVNPLTISMNPMKFYEYLAAGLPVVSTQKIVDDAKLLYHAKNYEEFSAGVSRVIAENTPEFRDYRKSYARENSWGKRVDEMMRIIQK